MTASVTLRMVMPAGWYLVALESDKEDAVERAVAFAFRHADRDSSAVAKHWMRERLLAASSPAPGSGAEVVALAYPAAPVGGVTLPVTCTVLRLTSSPIPGEEPMRALAQLAAGDASSVPVPTADAISLRTHHVADRASAFRAEVATAPITEAERQVIVDEAQHMPMLRVLYTLPPFQSESWHIISFSAMLGTDEAELIDVYLNLCDAFVGSARWESET